MSKLISRADKIGCQQALGHRRGCGGINEILRPPCLVDHGHVARRPTQEPLVLAAIINRMQRLPLAKAGSDKRRPACWVVREKHLHPHRWDVSELLHGIALLAWRQRFDSATTEHVENPPMEVGLDICIATRSRRAQAIGDTCHVRAVR
jgi:hypothetical protein